MHKRLFIVYGWDGHPKEGWFPWLERELIALGFDVHIPLLPDSGNPRIHTWVPTLTTAVGTADAQTYFVGHSMGCQTIARYIETLPLGVVVGGAVFVAGFFKHLTGLEEDADVQETDRHWLGAPIDLAAVKSHLPKSIAIFSDDDPYVPLDNQDDFREKLGSEIVIEHHAGHFSGNRDGTTELPVAIASIEKLSRS